MDRTRSRVERVARAVAEGQPVDWAAVLDAGLTSDERRSVDQLHLIQQIAWGIGDENEPLDSGPRAVRVFDPPQWNLVLASGSALESLCRRYWFPVYAEVRVAGNEPPRALDLTQRFFQRLLERRTLDAATQQGRFRTFLKASVRSFLSRRVSAERGDLTQAFPVDLDAAERLLALERSCRQDPKGVFDRCWARVLMGHVLARLRDEVVRRHDVERIESLSELLCGASGTARYADLAVQGNTTEAEIRLTVHRLRRQLRSLLREEVAHTVQDSRKVSEEIRLLLSVTESWPGRRRS